MSNIGSYLRELRQEKNFQVGGGYYSLNAVAKRAGIAHSYLSQIETGKVENPSPDILRKLADALKHPYVDLLKWAGYLPDVGSKEIDILEHLSSETIEALKDPLARKALLTTFKANKQVKEQVESVLEHLANMDPERIAAVARLLSA